MRDFPLRALALAALLAMFGCTPAPLSLVERIAAFEFAAQPYNGALLDLSDDQVIAARGNDGALGVSLRLGAQGWGRRFVIEAQAEGADDIRLRLNRRGTYLYIAVPAGEPFSFALGIHFSEALIYSSEADALSLQVRRITDCSQEGEDKDDFCFTIEDLRATALAGAPAPANSFEQLRTLLNWASNEVDLAGSADLAARADQALGRYSSAQMYAALYRSNRGGGYCGATAVFFARMLRDMGYDAASIDYGAPGTTLTHVTTIVRNPDDGEFYLLDPTFNFYLVRRDTGAPATFHEVLTLPVDLLDFVLAPMTERDFLVPEDNYRSRDVSASGLHDCRHDRHAEMYVCRKPGYGLDQYIVETARLMRENGLSPTREGFFCRCCAGIIFALAALARRVKS